MPYRAYYYFHWTQFFGHIDNVLSEVHVKYTCVIGVDQISLPLPAPFNLGFYYQILIRCMLVID